MSFLISLFLYFLFFFFNDTATTEIYTLSLHDALPISHVSEEEPRVREVVEHPAEDQAQRVGGGVRAPAPHGDRKSTRLNSSHGYISYAVFCLKKKKKKKNTHQSDSRTKQ